MKKISTILFLSYTFLGCIKSQTFLGFHTKLPASYSGANIVGDGNSLMRRIDGSQEVWDIITQLSHTTPFQGTNVTFHNFGVGGQTTANMSSDAAVQIDTLYNPAVKNILIVWEVTNDIGFNQSISGAITRMTTYCNARRAAGWKVVLLTCIPRGGLSVSGQTQPSYDNDLVTANTSLIAGEGVFADKVIDLRSDSRLFAVDPVYYRVGDVTHLNQEGYRIVVEKIMEKILTF